MSDLLKMLAVTAELMGTEWSESAAEMVVEELAVYPIADIKQALSRCRKELKGRLTLTDILDRVHGGHPGPQEAWSLASKSVTGKRFEENEQATIVWTDEMREAFGVARMLSDDKIAARLAFLEKYTQLVSQARVNRTQPHWTISIGYDTSGREIAVQEAVLLGRLSIEQARRVVPSLLEPSQECVNLTKRIG